MFSLECLFLSVNNQHVSVTDACRQLEDAGHISVLLVWVELDVGFRDSPHWVNIEHTADL